MKTVLDKRHSGRIHRIHMQCGEHKTRYRSVWRSPRDFYRRSSTFHRSGHRGSLGFLNYNAVSYAFDFFRMKQLLKRYFRKIYDIAFYDKLKRAFLEEKLYLDQFNTSPEEQDSSILPWLIVATIAMGVCMIGLILIHIIKTRR